MGTSAQLQEGLPPIGCLRSAETVVATRKKSWRLDGHKLDRQRDLLGVSETESISSARLVLPAGRRGRGGPRTSQGLRALRPLREGTGPTSQTKVDDLVEERRAAVRRATKGLRVDVRVTPRLYGRG